MTTLSYSQQQLLKALQITPVKLVDAFAVELPTATDTLAPDLSQPLAQDIAAVLPDSLSWQINPDAVLPAIQQQQLVTPLLSALQQAELKRALWALLSTYDEN